MVEETAAAARAEHRRRDNCRNKTRYYVRQGILKRQPCRVCGSEKVQAHHTDYDQPMLVDWLCHKHHCDEHRKLGGKKNFSVQRLEEDGWLDVRRAAELACVCQGTIRRAIQDKRLHAILVGRVWLTKREDIVAWYGPELSEALGIVQPQPTQPEAP